jgi:hypothetical protein
MCIVGALNEQKTSQHIMRCRANAFSRCSLSKVLRCIAVSHYANSSGGVGQKNQATATFCQLVNTKSVNHNLPLVTWVVYCVFLVLQMCIYPIFTNDLILCVFIFLFWNMCGISKDG